MKLNPQQAPLYGECVLTVQLDDNDVCRAAGEEVEFYLLFSGSTQRHVSSTLRVDHITLQATCPAHNVCEQVSVTLCLARPGGPVDMRSQENFCFVQDLALDMANFLLDNTAPEEALLFDDDKIPLKECEKLDQSLALALKHLSLPHHSQTHTYKESWSNVSTLLDSCSAVSQGTQLSSLLHLSASCGLRTVASFLLQQPGAREALRATNAQGQTPACVAQDKGHEQLVELFTRYETSSGVQLEPKEQLHCYQEDRVFQHHGNLGTYTLTFPSWQQKAEGAGTDGDKSCCVAEEVKELRRLIRLHRDPKGEFCVRVIASVGPACELQPCSGRQEESRWDADLAARITGNFTTISEERGSPLSLKERTASADVIQTSRNRPLCQNLESAGGQKGMPATKSPAGRKRKHKKRTTKTTRLATEINRSPLEASGITAQKPTETTATGCLLETEGSVSPRDTSVIAEGDATKDCGTEETLLPINPEATPAGNGKCADRKTATTITEKQEGEKWEVNALSREQVIQTETEQTDNQSHSRQNQLVESAANRTVTMGQEQSQDPQESQSDQEEPNQPDSTSKSPPSGSKASPSSPDMKGKHQRVLWRDGGWIGKIMGSAPLGSDTIAKNVWYQDKNVEQGASEESNSNEVNSRTVWYDNDEGQPEQLEQTEWGLSSPHELNKSPLHLLEQGLSSHQLCSALSQPHAAGAQPAPSHGLATQRQEVQGSQREEEVGPDWQEGGEEEGRREVSYIETTHSRKSSETVDLEEGGEEKLGGEEKEVKGRRKRRKKRGKRGGTEAKLSSSSSIESQSQNETLTEQVTNLNPQSETGSEAKDQTGRAHVRSLTISEPTRREEADKDAMHLPSQTQSQTRDSHEPDCADTTTLSGYTSPTDHGGTEVSEVMALQALETKVLAEEEKVHGSDDFKMDSTVALSEHDMDVKKADAKEITIVLPIGTEVLNAPKVGDLKGATSPTWDDVESKASSEHERRTVAIASVDQTALLEGKNPKECPVKSSEPVELTEDLFLVVFPEDNTQCTQSVDKLLQPVDSMEKPNTSLECMHPTEAACLPCEGTADVTPLQIREGSPEMTARECLEHCLSSEMLRDQQHREEKIHELRVGEDEGGKEASLETTNGENDCGVECGEELSSTDEGKKLEFTTSNSTKVQKYHEDLVATAVAVVTVAVASAMATIELTRQLAGRLPESPGVANTPALAEGASVPTEKQPIHQSHTEATDKFCSDRQNDVTVSESVELQCKTETYTSGLPLAHKEEIQSDATLNKLFPCLLSEEDKQQVNMNPLPKTSDLTTAEVDGHGHRQIQLSCPLVDGGQCSELPSDALCMSTECKHGQIESDVQLTSSDFQNKEVHTDATDKDCLIPVESVTANCEAGGQAHEQSSPENSESRTEESDICLSITDRSHSACQAEEDQSESQTAEMPHARDSRALPLSPSPTLPLTPYDSTPEAGPGPDEPVANVNMDSGELPSSQSLKGPNLVVAHSESVVVDGVCDKNSDSVDTVDGWKHRERKKLELEAREAIPHAEAEKIPDPERDSEQTSSDTLQMELIDSIRAHQNVLNEGQIRREKDISCPAQPCPQPSTVSSCTDVHPDREECVSLCVMQRDDESLQVGAKLDDGVFKKPDPPPSVGHSGLWLRVSKDAAIQGDNIPNEGASQAGAANAEASRSSRLSWKSETEDRGGGPTERGGGEENKAQRPENPSSSAMLRASIRSMSPFLRHSWEPGRSSAAADIDIPQRSSLNSLSGEAKRAKPPLHRRSMSWCPSNLCPPDQEQIDNRSYSLERLEVQRAGVQTPCPTLSIQEEMTAGRSMRLDSQERGSLISLTEEEQEGDGVSIQSQTSSQVLSMTSSCPAMFHHQTLTKSISMVTISHRDIDVRGFIRSKRRISFSLSISPLLSKNRRFFSIGSSSSDEEEEGGRLSSFSSNASSLENSISEEEPGPLRSEAEAKGGPRISRTFSYLRNKISKKGKEKERRGDRERESKDKEKKTANGHVFIPVCPSPSTACQHCTRLLHNKETFLCNNCGAHVHKSCRESLTVCTKSKTKQQSLVPDAGPGSAVNMRSKSTSSASSASSTSPLSSREPWSVAPSPDDQLPSLLWRPTSILNSHTNLAKSISISNIAGIDDAPLKSQKFLSQSTDNLHQGNKVNASTESLTDEGTEMMDSQLMGEFECDIRDLEADSWSGTVDKKFLKTLKKDEVKRQDVIYELYQTEFHHVRTLKIMSEVYYKGLQREMQLDTQTLDKIFPLLDELLDAHSQFLNRLLEAKRASSAEGRNSSSVLIRNIGAVLVTQFSDISADRMKKVYGKFCSRHNEAVNLYKDVHAKDKRFQAFIKKTMSSSIVRRLSIPECILLVTQRITKYPVLMQRILQHTKDSDGDYSCVGEALRLVKELITAVDSKVNEHEKKRRLREVYSRTDSKSIMRMKSGQMFAKEDLIRGRKLLHDGALQLKNSAGRLKDVHAMLLSDVLVFLQEKDQKYVFASLDQRSTVISLQNLIVREVANAERGLFLITAGTDRPEMVEVLASTKEERNTWRAIIQDAMHCMEKDEDEGVPSETEEDRRQQESRAKEIRELLCRKDEQIVSLLEEKVHIFREMGDSAAEDTSTSVRERMLFRATPDDVTKGEPIMKDALREVESLHTLVSSGVGGAGRSAPAGLTGGSVGPVCLPRRAETFGGFDSHLMNSSKNGEKEEGDESLDLRRTESDSVLKKGATASLQMLLKRNTEQVQQCVTHLHSLLISLQAVVVQQDSFIEDQRQTLNERLTANSSRHSSSSSLSSSSSSRPSSLIEQEKHRSLERQRQEAASLQKQQAAHQEERRRREKEWELKERGLEEWEERLREEEDETRKRHQELLEEKESLQRKKEEFQREVERMQDAQRKLERDKETLRRDTERLEAAKKDESEKPPRYQRSPSTTSEESLRFHSSGSLDLESKEAAEVELSSSAPTKEHFLRIGSKRMSKNFNPFSSSSSSKPQGAEKESQLPTRLLHLTKPKEKKEKKKKKGKGGEQAQTESKSTVVLDPQGDGDIFFC